MSDSENTTQSKPKPKHSSYYDDAIKIKDRLNAISPTMCMAKWSQVSMHLPSGLTQSCYHPPTHTVPLDELAISHKALHNTKEKIEQRKLMLKGERPAGCQYCWNIEDAQDGPHLSDRHYRSSEDWAQSAWDEVVSGKSDETINPRYVEVNFNQACNFKCTYCSPHLSTALEKENEKFGKFNMPSGGSFHDIDDLRARGLMPIPGKNSENPYVKAFWEWWPDLYKDLKVFRMTGGEPLMDANTFKVLEYVNSNPKPDLELSITSNMCPPDQKLFDKFIASLKKIEELRIWEDQNGHTNTVTNNNWFIAPACKNFTLFVSVDSIGKQAEYIRSGLDYDRMLSNVRQFLRETDGTVVSFINTFNILSIPKIKDFMQMILDLRIEFGYDTQNFTPRLPPIDKNGEQHPPIVYYEKRQRIWFDIPYLRLPDWLSCQTAAFYPDLMKKMEECLEFMEANLEKADYGSTYNGFKPHEIAKLKRNISWMKMGENDLPESTVTGRKKSFYTYFKEIDRRRETSFINTFPEMGKWWADCYLANKQAMNENTTGRCR